MLQLIAVLCENLFEETKTLWNCHHDFLGIFYFCECTLAVQLWLKIIAHIGKLSHFICISKAECVGLS